VACPGEPPQPAAPTPMPAARRPSRHVGAALWPGAGAWHSAACGCGPSADAAPPARGQPRCAGSRPAWQLAAARRGQLAVPLAPQARRTQCLRPWRPARAAWPRRLAVQPGAASLRGGPTRPRAAQPWPPRLVLSGCALWPSPPRAWRGLCAHGSPRSGPGIARGTLARAARLEQPRRGCSRPCTSRRTGSWVRWIVAT
jgi:hypothetical protein